MVKARAKMEMQTREVTFEIPEELLDAVDEVAKMCGIRSVDVVCVALNMLTDITNDGKGLEYLQGHANKLKAKRANQPA